MAVHNIEIINKLSQVADLLDIKGENQFRIRAYRNAVRTLSGFSKNISEMVKEGEDLSSISGIGESISEKIEEIAKSGKLKQLDKLKKEIPESLIEIMKLEQMGPQRTKILNEELGIESIEDLKKAAKNGEIEKVEGFGKKTAGNILQEAEAYTQTGGSPRIKRSEAEKLVMSLVI